MPLFEYRISASDTFHSSDYPELAKELEALAAGIRFMPGYGKVQATVSFLKNHSIQTSFVLSNPVLVDMIRFGKFKIAQLESMFESCRHNKTFLADYEKYIYDGLNEHNK